MRKLYILLAATVLSSTLSVAQVNLSSGLVAYYPFNGNFLDASGNGHHGQQYGGVSFAADQWGNPNSAASFDGLDDYILIAPSAQLTPDSAFSVAFRFRTEDTNGHTIISKSSWLGTSTTNNIQYQIGFNFPTYVGGNGLFFGTDHNGSCATTNFLAGNYVTAGSSVAKETWYCAIMTFSKGVKKLYVNGSLINQQTVQGMVNDDSVDYCTAGDIKLGAWWVGDPQFFHGLMDEIRFYNRSLNQEEAIAYCSQVINDITDMGQATPAVEIYPNPVTDVLNISIKNCKVSSLAVYNQLGQQVKQVTVTGGKIQLNTEGLAKGAYLLKLQTTEGVITKEFIK
jgi:hypothetical protein